MIRVAKVLILISLFFWLRPTEDYFQTDRLVVWNVRQGQWVSYITSRFCHHFDAGGEKFPSAVIKHCLGKENRLSVSHWDFDHISFLFQAKKRGLDFCISDLPSDDHTWKLSIEQWRRCESYTISAYLETFNPVVLRRRMDVPQKVKRRNDTSLVFKISLSRPRVETLITGDAPSKVERILHRKMNIKNIQVLVAGHHGSITSSSEDFLKRMKHLRLVLVSARQSKYGHPHPVVVSRFRRMRVPLLSTNDWGHLVIELE